VKTSSRKPSTSKAARKPATPPKKKAAPLRTATLDKAIKDYEEALRLFAKKEFSKAAHLFEALIKDSPTEREVADRSRMYLSICKAQTASAPPKPKSAQDHYLLGVIASNEGRLEDAADLFDRMIKIDSGNDRGYYELAAVCSLRNDRAGAVSNLSRAIDINPANRVYALNDADFDALREDSEFMQLLGKTLQGGA